MKMLSRNVETYVVLMGVTAPTNVCKIALPQVNMIFNCSAPFLFGVHEQICSPFFSPCFLKVRNQMGLQI